MGLLNKTKVYCIGHMQYKDGSAWREYVREELTSLGITVFNPYDNPFIKDINQDRQAFEIACEMINDGQMDDAASYMRMIRSYDLSLVDRSDFIIGHITAEVASWGTAEELVTAVRAKRPIFLSVEGGIKNCPLWILGMFPHKYLYNSVTEIVDMIRKIDNEEVEIDSDRWRLLRPEWR